VPPAYITIASALPILHFFFFSVAGSMTASSATVVGDGRRLQELLLRSDAIQLLDLTNCSALRHLALPALQPGNSTGPAGGPLPPVRQPAATSALPALGVTWIEGVTMCLLRLPDVGFSLGTRIAAPLAATSHESYGVVSRYIYAS